MIVPRLKNETNGGILKVIAQIGKIRGIDCMNFQSFCRSAADMPVYAFVNEGEVVIIMIDWSEKPLEEIADESEFKGNKPLYFSEHSHRTSPVWRLSEFMREYTQALSDSQIFPTRIWGILISNSNFLNYKDMTVYWKLMNITVYHNYGVRPIPDVYYSIRFHAEALAQYKAFRLYCEQHGYIKKDPYAFEDIDADYDEMEYGIDDEDEEIDIDLDDLSDFDDLLEEDDAASNQQQTSSIGSIMFNQNNVVNVEILDPISSPRKKLSKLVGCQNIKSQISDLFELTRYNQWMRNLYPNWKQHSVSLHAIFFGRPGTGKTTVCKIYGGLLKETGMLSKGHVVVCSRSSFIGNNWGDEEKAIRQIIELAQGGVLMIDEAYLLNSNHPNDPGKLILPQLMDILANEKQRDIAIVLCGYKEPMLRLLDLNPGLASRFPNRFEFQDFSIDELMQITLHRISEYGYHFTQAGLRRYKEILSEAYAERDPQTWGNARFIANLLEHIYMLHARRCMGKIRNRTSANYFSITSSDIQPIEVPKDNRKIGF